jgi:hypothetical protein
MVFAWITELCKITVNRARAARKSTITAEALGNEYIHSSCSYHHEDFSFLPREAEAVLRWAVSVA